MAISRVPHGYPNTDKIGMAHSLLFLAGRATNGIYCCNQ
jgi:hypothetical protein